MTQWPSDFTGAFCDAKHSARDCTSHTSQLQTECDTSWTSLKFFGFHLLFLFLWFHLCFSFSLVSPSSEFKEFANASSCHLTAICSVHSYLKLTIGFGQTSWMIIFPIVFCKGWCSFCRSSTSGDTSLKCFLEREKTKEKGASYRAFTTPNPLSLRLALKKKIERRLSKNNLKTGVVPVRYLDIWPEWQVVKLELNCIS